MFLSATTALAVVLYCCCVSQWTTEGHWESSREKQNVCVCVCCFQQAHCKQDWHHPWRLCVTDFVLNCPFLETLAQTQHYSFLIEMFHSLPCKHPARLAGARTNSTSPPQSASKGVPTTPNTHPLMLLTLALMLCVVFALQALRNRTAPRQLRRTCWQHWGPGRKLWRKH